MNADGELTKIRTQAAHAEKQRLAWESAKDDAKAAKDRYETALEELLALARGELDEGETLFDRSA